MMKRYFILTFLICLALCTFGQEEYLNTKLGKTELRQIEKGTLVDFNLSEHAKGKVVIIEFWEVWCAPCIQAMHHLNLLKQQFPNELEIICISSDNFEKTVEFIERHKFPFTFIYDKEKYLKQEVFPHTGIPHSIVVDKTGKIVANTMPGFLTLEVVDNLISNNEIDVPSKTKFNLQCLTEGKSENTLIKFELRSYQLGDRGTAQTCTSSRTRRILTNFQGGYIDTAENTLEHTAANQSILDLYEIAYNIPRTRFVFDKELKYLNCHLPNNRYTMIFSVSDLFGNPQSMLINLLNGAFGLTTKQQKRTVEILVLDSIKTDNSYIKQVDATGQVQIENSLSIAPWLQLEIKASHMNSAGIINYLEAFFRIPVETEISNINFYEVKINIDENMPESVDTWIELLKECGLVLRRETKTLKYIEIEKIM